MSILFGRNVPPYCVRKYEVIKDIQRSFTILLTATPIHNKLEDLHNEMQLIENYMDRYSFKRIVQDISYENLNTIYEGAIRRKLRKNVKEIDELIPDREVVIEKVNASKKEYSLYENLADYIGYNSYYHSLIMREKKGLGVLYIYTFLKQLSSSPYAVKARLETIKARIMEALQLGKIVIGEKELLEEEDESIDLAESVLEIILQDSEKNALQKELETINRYIKELENINISAKELKIRKIINSR